MQHNQPVEEMSLNKTRKCNDEGADFWLSHPSISVRLQRKDMLRRSSEVGGTNEWSDNICRRLVTWRIRKRRKG